MSGMSEAEGVSDTLCRHIATATWESLSDPAREGARQVLLDATGVIYAASGLAKEAAPFITLAKGNGTGPCSILGTGERVQPLAAALANGALAHAVDYEDAFDRAPAHPNASLVPVLLAIAQSRAPIDGRRFLTALAVGGDFACRMTLALRQPMEKGGWYPPPIIAAYGAVAGAANLLGLSPDQVRDALSLVLCQVTMPGEIKYSRQTVLRAVREAFPAQAALSAALLAQEGVAGFEAPLEGKAGFYALYAGGQFSVADLTDRLGQHYWGSVLTFKPWPSCRGTHPFIEMALNLKACHGFSNDDIASIVVDVDGVQAMLVEPLERKRAPDVAIDAKFSIPFTLALALSRGHVRLDDFDETALRDPDISGLASKVASEVRADPDWQKGVGGAMRVTMRDGRVFSTHIRDALGCPDRPLSSSARREKFIDCLSRAAQPVSADAASLLAERIETLDECEDVGQLFS